MIVFPFFGFRIMVGIAVVFMLGRVVLTSLWLRWRGTALPLRRVVPPVGCTLASPLGFVAVLAGWGDDRSRAPAMDSLRAPAHGRFGVSIADGASTSRSRSPAICVVYLRHVPRRASAADG